MADISKFLQKNKLLIKWTIGYFFCLWLILRYVFDFEMLSWKHWARFFNQTLHGFWGLVFVVTIYGAALIYIATVMIIYRKNKPIMEIPVPKTVKNISSNISKIFSDSKTTTSENTETKSETKESSDEERPSGLPPELYGTYMRAKQRKNEMGTNSEPKTAETPKADSVAQPQSQPEIESFPIPSDFDISDSLPDTPIQTDDDIPTFKDLNFDIPIQSTQDDTKNTVMKYCEKNGIEYATMDEFVMMKKYLIYDHADTDFWVMDEETWFASGRQIKSPIQKLIDRADQNALSPVMYFESRNVLEIDHVISTLEKRGVRVISDLSELP